MNKRRKNLENLKDVQVTREGILFPNLRDLHYSNTFLISAVFDSILHLFVFLTLSFLLFRVFVSDVSEPNHSVAFVVDLYCTLLLELLNLKYGALW